MPVIVGWLLGLLESRIGSIVISALLSLGLSFTSYTFSVAPLRNYIISAESGIPGKALGILGWLKVDVAVTMLLSAVASKYAVKGAQAILTRKRAS